ncbi:MAG: hypothetical protein CMN76_11395 [Spirochaetaceae bacterium]|nr:hypothetical protein [Spirochaetaceae bacterium]|tara:strand:+ start:1201 stop:1728 length:528 start_codon:yes stop_codon:yes gene_type:complete
MNLPWMRVKMEPNTFLDTILTLFGTPQLVRIFEPPLPKRINGRYYPVDKLVMYASVEFLSSGSDVAKTKKTQHVTLMFYRSELKIAFVRVAELGASNHVLLSAESSPNVLRSDTSDRELWVGSFCDSLYHKERVLGLDVASGYPCYWKASDFDSLLAEDGYYDRRRAGYSLAKDW